MGQAVLKLDELEKYADTTVPFILSSHVTRPDILIGRDEELEIINQWFAQNKENCLFITGMGGIGKSTLIREYIAENQSQFDNILYLHYSGSFQSMIADDEQLCVNTIEKREEESVLDYYKRKLKNLRELAAGTQTVVVIDNFAGKIEQDFISFLNADWKVIVITRSDKRVQGYSRLHIQAIKDREDLYALFEENLQETITEEDRGFLDRMIAQVSGHTLVLELIAKQVAKSYLSIKEAAVLAEKHGFSHMAPEKVDFEKDGLLYYEKISDIITALFAVNQMSVRKRVILRALSFFNMPGIDIQTFQEILGLASKDDINELIDEGWVNVEEMRLFLHPVVRETICQWEWTDEHKTAAFRMMNHMLKQIKLEGKKKEDSLKVIETDQHVKNAFEKNEKRVEPYTAKNGGIGEETCNRISHRDIQEENNYRQINQYLRLSEDVLACCKKEITLYESDIYKELLYHTIIHMPRDREEYILKHAEELLSDTSCIDKYDKLKLFDMVVCTYDERKDFDMAYKTIMKAKSFVQKGSDHYAKGQYFFILSDYYDVKLDGYYEPAADEDDRMLACLLDSLNKAIYHMKWSGKPDSKELLAKYMLSKVIILIRSVPEKKKKIRKLLATIKKLTEEYAGEYSEVRCAYYMSCAWYYTYVKPDEVQGTKCIAAAYETGLKAYSSELDMIDAIVIPAANIFLELENYDESARWITAGIEICDKKGDIVPYLRKKMDLYTYLLDIFYMSGDFARCREIIERIDNASVLYKDMDIVKEIPYELREEVLQG